MHLKVDSFTVHKRFPLTISRGTTAQSTNVWVRLEHDGVEGWGEASPFSTGDHPQTSEVIVRSLQQIMPLLAPMSPWNRQQIEQLLHHQALPSAARAAIDMALQDWMGKSLGVPLWQLWGLDRAHIKPTSVTIGINTPEGAQQRVQDWLEFTDVRVLKVKLGNPLGIEADQVMFKAVREQAPGIQQISIDANGGWSLEDATLMSHWLAEQGVTYIEQPLVRGQEDQLIQLSTASPLPIFVDESCWVSQDIPRLADRVQGINIKLMKSGGLTEALRMIHTARAFNLQVMLGCYSDSALSNTAAAHLAPLADYLDLDSHLNLVDDPFQGALIQDGILQLSLKPGLGVQDYRDR
jgi:L-Ala-D/L-Glu epimerase